MCYRQAPAVVARRDPYRPDRDSLCASITADAPPPPPILFHFVLKQTTLDKCLHLAVPYFCRSPERVRFGSVRLTVGRLLLWLWLGPAVYPGTCSARRDFTSGRLVVALAIRKVPNRQHHLAAMNSYYMYRQPRDIDRRPLRSAHGSRSVCDHFRRRNDRTERRVMQMQHPAQYAAALTLTQGLYGVGGVFHNELNFFPVDFHSFYGDG